MSNKPAPDQATTVSASAEPIVTTTNLVEQAKNEVETIKSLKGSLEEIQQGFAKAHEAAKSDMASFTEAKTNMEALKKQVQTQSSTITTRIAALEGEITNLEGQKNQVVTLLSEIQQLKTTIEQSKATIDTDVQIITKTKADFESQRNQAQTIKIDLDARQKDAQAQVTEIQKIYDTIKKLNDSLLKDEVDAEGKIIKESLTNKINGLVEKMKLQVDSLTKHGIEAKSDIKQLKADLEKEIRSLLPEAGAAGLSSAYVQAKSKYGAIPYVGETRWGHFWHYIRSHIEAVIYYVLFIVPLVIMVFLFVDLFMDLKADEVNGEIMALRALIALPLAVISYFGWSSIRLGRRLYEEYNHKQRVMQLYHSFKEEINSIGTEEHKKALLTIMLKAVDDKPSLAMNKYDKGMEGMLPSINWGNFLPGLKKKIEE